MRPIPHPSNSRLSTRLPSDHHHQFSLEPIIKPAETCRLCWRDRHKSLLVHFSLWHPPWRPSPFITVGHNSRIPVSPFRLQHADTALRSVTITGYLPSITDRRRPRRRAQDGWERWAELRQLSSGAQAARWRWQERRRRLHGSSAARDTSSISAEDSGEEEGFILHEA